MACGCEDTGTQINGSLIINETLPQSKIIYPTGTQPPAKGNWPISLDYFNAFMDTYNGGGGEGSTIGLGLLGYSVVDSFGGGVGKTGAENGTAFRNALADAMEGGNGIVKFSYGRYVIDPQDLAAADIENITIEGVGFGTILQMSTTVGDAVFKLRGTTGVTIRNMQVDVEDSTATGAGGIWVSGIKNVVENVVCRNGDGFSICVIGSYSNGVTFVPTPTFDNIVRNCYITGQRRYHSIGGKAALLVAEAATRTICENIYLVDNFLALETGDYAGNDHGLYTTFRNITCIKTSEGLAPGAGLHLEGGEDYDDMFVTIENMTAINFTVGTSVSEKSKARYIGQNIIKDCKYAIKSYGIYTSEFNNFEIIDCGAGLESSLTEGIINNAKSGIFRNIVTTGTLAENAFVNYNADSGSSVSTPVDLIGCVFDKEVVASYANVGSYYFNMRGCRLNSTSLVWYDNTGLWVDIEECFFNNSKIAGARVGDARVKNSTFSGSGTGTAIDLTLDSFNTRISSCRFRSYAYAHSNGTWGLGNTCTSVTNTPVNPEDMMVKGSDNTRGAYYGNWTDELPSGFWTSPGSGSGVPFASAYPFIRIVGHESNGGSSLGNSGWWAQEFSMNIDSGPAFRRRKHGGTGHTAHFEILDTEKFPITFTSPADNHTLRYKSGQWVNELTSGNTSSRPASGLVTGQMYFDTTLGKPIWRNGSNWVDATGTTV